MTDLEYEHPPFTPKIRGQMNPDGHTYDGFCPRCDGAPLSYRCEFFGDSVVVDYCEHCGNREYSLTAGVNMDHLNSCHTCNTIYCDDCQHHHKILKTGPPKG